jgi:hypothetical protein
VTPPVSKVDWPKSHRIIRTIYPPVWLFEDIADPADWELIASAEAKTNPRVRDEIGDVSLVPIARRVSGVGASIVMGAFTHCSADRPGRFSKGAYGVWYAGDRFDVALMETIHHHEVFMRRTDEPAAESQFREVTAHVAGQLHDIRGPGFEECRRPDDYAHSQELAAQLRGDGADGIVYPSVRWPDGEAVALFWPDLVRLPVVQARHMLYHWDGAHVSRFFVYGEDRWYARPVLAA